MGRMRQVILAAVVLCCARAEAEQTGLSCHDFGAPRGNVCCEAWVANAVLDGNVTGSRIGSTYEEVAEEVAYWERHQPKLCATFRTPEDCDTVYEEPKCRDSRASASSTQGAATIPTRPEPGPIQDAGIPEPDWQPPTPFTDQALAVFAELAASYDLPGCNPFTSLQEGIDAIQEMLARCGEALSSRHDCGAWNPMIPNCGEYVERIDRLKQDPRALWKLGDTFTGAAGVAATVARGEADLAYCQGLADKLGTLQLPEATPLTLERAAVARQMKGSKRTGTARVVFSGLGSVDDGETINPRDYLVVFVQPAEDCKEVEVKPAVVQEMPEDPRGRILHVTGQIGDSQESLEIIEPHLDTDGDTIPDRWDDCPTEEGFAKWRGCPDPDPDGDGVYRDVDLCPDEKGTELASGCPDRDKDGVPNHQDKCLKTKGDAAFAGCPPDTDGDGVIDKKDRCPDLKGEAKFKGCPDPDPDRDGVKGDDDLCPDEAGLKKLQGCPDVDSDGDGIVDRKDDCPNKAGEKKFKGCPDPDPDRDGVKGSADLCPDVKGKAKHDGCLDTDGDGTHDFYDKCPFQVGHASQGCPDADNDGIVDHLDSCAYEYGEASRNGCPVRDRDGDGIEDADDSCPDDYATGTGNGCPVTDRDQDGIEDDDDQCPDTYGPAKFHGCQGFCYPPDGWIGADYEDMQRANDVGHNECCCYPYGNNADQMKSCFDSSTSFETWDACCPSYGGTWRAWSNEAPVCP